MSISTQITVVADAETIVVTAPGALRGPMGDVTPEVTALVERAEAAKDQAGVSAGQAAGSAAQAATDAASALDSKTSALSSAEQASASEIAAKDSEVAAAASESEAATSETNSAQSAADALSSKNAAETSEGNAATSESNAANSATSASNSATTATQAAANAAAEFESIFQADQLEREQEFDAAQADRDAQFKAQLLASGFELPAIPYADGTPLVIARPTQLIIRGGQLYRVKADKEFPYTLTGTWATDAAKLVSVGDSALRQDLIEDAGSEKVSYLNPATGAARISLAEKLAAGARNVEEFRQASDPDDTLSIQRAIDWANTAYNASTYRAIPILFNPQKSYVASGFTMKPGVFLIGSLGGYAGATLTLTKSNGFGIDTPATAVNFAGIAGFKIVGQGGAINNGGLRWQLGHECIFRDLVLLNFQNQGFSFVAGAANEFSHIFADNCVLNRTRSAPIGAVEIFGTDGQIFDIEASAGITIDMGRTSADLHVKALWVGGSTHFVDSCVGEFADVGMYITASTSIFTGNRSDFSQGPGWQLEGGQNRHFAGIALNNSQHADAMYPGFQTLGAAGKGNKFSACRALSTNAKRHNYGFYDETTSSSAGPSEYSLCDSSGQALKKFFTASNSSSIIHFPVGGKPRAIPDVVGVPDITGFCNFASANTVPATYSNFSGGEDGQRITIIAKNANCRIANNANILTSTAANLVLAVNQSATFLYDGATWTQV